MALVRITRAILGDEHSVLTVSSFLDGKYRQKGVYAGAPSIVGRDGIKDVIELTLLEEELNKMEKSCNMLRSLYPDLEI